ncbi:unnamed protein product [Haemonchus placei]|uniref:G_PROTEIN_RECEP_F1_2 domain-containing protein n=1 Tax=Haemonchus placei TaxID=6290 RepID=A0A0N4X5C0_HAEPC|nr:unnamed protein product [Haemonchus placei]
MAMVGQRPTAVALAASEYAVTTTLLAVGVESCNCQPPLPTPPPPPPPPSYRLSLAHCQLAARLAVFCSNPFAFVCAIVIDWSIIDPY